MGTRKLMALTAAQEMNHLVLTYASCIDADDEHGKSTCTGRLAQLAKNFGVHQVTDLVLESSASAQNLLMAIAQWQASQAA